MIQISASWVYLLIALIALSTYFYSSRVPEKIAPFRALFNFVICHRVSRFAILVIWWWIGWHFLGSLQPISD
jgi:hypothetical protein